MKKLFILILLFATAFPRSESQNPEVKTVDNLKLINTIAGGCALSDKYENERGEDGVKYFVTNKNLDIKVGFNLECCGKYTTSSIIKKDTIIICINRIRSKLACDCICYYSYNFKYSGLGKSYNYKISVENCFYYEGKIKAKKL